MPDLDDDWRPWRWSPPNPNEWTVIEWMRSFDIEPHVARVEDLLHPSNAAWNIEGVSWRPVS